MNKWFAGCDNVKLFELHKNGLGDNFSTLKQRVVITSTLSVTQGVAILSYSIYTRFCWYWLYHQVMIKEPFG